MVGAVEGEVGGEAGVGGLEEYGVLGDRRLLWEENKAVEMARGWRGASSAVAGGGMRRGEGGDMMTRLRLWRRFETA